MKAPPLSFGKYLFEISREPSTFKIVSMTPGYVGKNLKCSNVKITSEETKSRMTKTKATIVSLFTCRVQFDFINSLLLQKYMSNWGETSVKSSSELDDNTMEVVVKYRVRE